MVVSFGVSEIYGYFKDGVSLEKWGDINVGGGVGVGCGYGVYGGLGVVVV